MYDAHNTNSETDLPGKLVRAEGEAKVKDEAVNEAFDNVGLVLEFYKEHFKWKSIDNKNADVLSSVHFGQKYENACKLPFLSYLLCFFIQKEKIVAESTYTEFS